MELATTEKLAKDLMKKHGLSLDVWQFKFDNSKRRFGVCKHTYNRVTKQTVRGTISLSKHLVQANGEAEVKDTILHEIAHALTPAHGHDIVWQRKAKEIGARPERCFTDKEVNTVKHLARYQATCSGCGIVHVKHRMTVRVMNAKIACNCQAKYSWDKKILLNYIDTKKINIMKTNFSKERFLVLTETYSDKIVAIIQCEAGEHDIKEKVYQAIEDDFCPTTMCLIGENYLTDSMYYHSFQVEIFDNDRVFEQCYTLNFAEVY